MKDIISASIALIVAYVILKSIFWIFAIAFKLVFILITVVIAIPIFLYVKKKIIK